MQFLRASRAARAFLVLIGLALGAFPATTLAAAVSGELVVADQRSGVALYGFDPVSYFLDGAARPGSEAFEIRFQGLVWRFRNEANREAFRAQPDIYVPQFGGYDPLALSRGAPVPGHPSLFAVHGRGLYLFQNEENRSAFLARPEAAIDSARSAWPHVRRSLVH
jgi:hypothetical protein